MGAGARNVVFRCGDVVLKSTGRSEAALRWLVTVQAAARQVGFVTADPVPARNGRLIAGGWTAERFLPGRIADPRDLSALAPRIAAFHRAARRFPPRPGVPGMAVLLRLGRGGGVVLPAMPRKLAKAIRAAFADVADTPQGVVHGDLNPGNVIVTNEGPALVDWDESRHDALCLDRVALGLPATRAERRAALAWEIACCWAPEPERARSLARGFIRSAGAAPIP
ncbi:phosphotransferase [Salipiger abyssi]|uniref:phosphotransferase n=1 Tax=Salipiger abyssi TaxID=1250539 RepID=UPI00360AD4E1